MAPRIILIHPYRPSMAPIEEAFTRLWPEAEMLNFLDESLYADVGEDGVISTSVQERLVAIFRYAEQAMAAGAIFTGTTFGPGVEIARREVRIPVLKPDEAMAEAAVQIGQRIALMCTAKRALPVISAGINRAAMAVNRSINLTCHWVEGAQAALNNGDRITHDRLVAEAAARIECKVLLLGQISMAPSQDVIVKSPDRVILTSPDAAVTKMRSILGVI